MTSRTNPASEREVATLPVSGENARAVWDEEERQEIREWWRRFVKGRGARGVDASHDEELRRTRDLPIPDKLAKDVTGGVGDRPQRPSQDP
jgi:hypothetical protein